MKVPYSYIGFSFFLGIGPIKFNLLLDHFKEVDKAFGASESQLAKIIGPQTASKFASFRSQFNPQKSYEVIKQKQIEVLTREDARFPSSLLNLSDAPICLYVKGDSGILADDKLFHLGIVGSRRGTEYGIKTTRTLVAELSRQIPHLSIVSGLAYTIDAVAHTTALDQGVKTIAFLGCGVDIVYPYGNRRLYERILKEKGAIVSEFPPGETVVPGLFIARNRLISGLSRGVLIVEGTKTSGSLITARYAAEQGREVFAVPGRVDSPMSEAPHLLIREGATLTTSIDDILSAYDLKKKQMSLKKTEMSFTKEERLLFTFLDGESKRLDEIVSAIQLNVQATLTTLSRLELQGIVERGIDERYSVKAI
jgi:DNA processing protein